ncbi:MAG: class I SAM-dependent methyltransferase [Firmicutes bacterium]|nr:class I SAM-dependent methyltransferase [Bacillota bacterium]
MDYKKYWDYTRDDFSERPAILFQEEHLPYLDDCRKILDLGCGTGTLVRKLTDRGKEAVGVTYNRLEADFANERYGLELVCADMHDLPLADGSFEAIIMWDSLEHCQSPYIALCEARRVTRPGGKGLIFVPGQNWLDCHCHILVPTVPQMHQLFKQSGWKLVNTFEKKYPGEPGRYCEGMAVYEIENDPAYRAVFAQ